MVQLKTKEIKAVATAVKELNESYVDVINSLKGAVKETKTAKQLWRNGNNSKLIKLGLTLIVFPEPTPISETIGSVLVAAGVVQEGIRRRTLYIEDIYKTFQNTLKEIRETTGSLL
jgi:glycerol-3-phosphate O-acyltransferase